MQCNFTFYLFPSCSIAVPKVVMKYLFDYFSKPISPFSKFCVNCLLRFYFIYCNNCVLNAFWDAYLSLTWCSNIVQTQMKQLVYSFSFTSLFSEKSFVSYENESFFHLSVTFSDELFWNCTFGETFAIGFKNWSVHNGTELVFFVGIWLFSLNSYLFGLKSARNAQPCFFFDDIKWIA